MSWQLIYTSAPRGITAGQPGYGTVARDREMREALVLGVERLSYYPEHSRTGGGAEHDICAHRLIDVHGVSYHVLSRIRYAGLDFTKRHVHLAHHLAFAPGEVADLPSPAVIFLSWDGWRREWIEAPRWLGEGDWGNLRGLPRRVSLPAQAWQRLTQDAGRAAALVERPYRQSCDLVCPPGAERDLLELFSESLQLLDDGRTPGGPWQIPFTTFVQPGDRSNDFVWRGHSSTGTSRSAVGPASLPVPDGPAVERARHGRVRQPVPAPPSAPPSRSGLAERPAPRRNLPLPRLAIPPPGGHSSRPYHSLGPAEIRGVPPPDATDRRRGNIWGRAAAVLGVGVVLFLAAVGLKSLLWPQATSLASARPGHAKATEEAPSSVHAAPTGVEGVLRIGADPGGSARSSAGPIAIPATALSPEGALAHLTNTIALPTTIFLGSSTQLFQVPGAHPLGRMLRKCLQQHSSSGVVCHVRTGPLAALLAPSSNTSPAEFRFNPNTKTAEVPLPTGVIDLNFFLWAGQPEVELAPPIDMRKRLGDGPYAIEFRPLDGVMFEPCRLVVWPENALPDTCSLDLGLLIPDQRSTRESIHPAFWSLIKIIHNGRPVASRLRPYQPGDGTAPEWVFKGWTARDKHPTNEMDFARTRADLAKLINNVKVRQKQYEEDSLLGRLCQLPEADPLYCYDNFCQTNRNRGEEAYIQYLTNLLQRLEFRGVVLPADTAALLADKGTRRATLLTLPNTLTNSPAVGPFLKEFAALPEEFFHTRYKNATKHVPSDVTELPTHGRREELGRRLRHFEDLRRRFPSSLADLLQVDLQVPLGAERTIELFRFESTSRATDPSTPSSPPSTSPTTPPSP